ncbi:PREDICTED: WD repeat-containing protein 11-like [Tinamus guttatus]|uniref:WD repeat-containing protein 11-like n=1 Tax=Tinamus guttatus TaxID=94827 RepID=UPI00052EFD7A|nr:PREDICTED: WD repeat-containing protein 11-like [Tinamus guttatus]
MAWDLAELTCKMLLICKVLFLDGGKQKGTKTILLFPRTSRKARQQQGLCELQLETLELSAPGPLSNAVHGGTGMASRRGWQGLIAYGCHSLVLVVDANTAQTLQVLERHKANVVKVKWAKENYHHNVGSPYSLRLASADASGKIIVWDVATGTARCEIQEHAKPIQDMQWLWNQDASRDLLLAVHPPNYIVLWNADTGTKLWKKSYAENILSFSFDPFDPSHLACKFIQY